MQEIILEMVGNRAKPFMLYSLIRKKLCSDQVSPISYLNFISEISMKSSEIFEL